MYFYADGEDKAGNRLLTSYRKEDQAKRYRPGAKVSHAEKYMHILEDGSAVVRNEGNMLLRTLMSRQDEVAEMSGNFIVFAKINGRWEQTPFRYETYATANKAVKGALINLYQACAVVEMSEETTTTAKVEDEASI